MVGIYWAVVVAFSLLAAWYLLVGTRRASLHRPWAFDCETLPAATVDGAHVTIHHVRHFRWRSSRDHDSEFRDETYDLKELVGVWYAVEHFHSLKGLAHVMLSFEFRGDRFVSCSFETRRTRGQRYHPWTGLWRGYELLLLWGGEEDLLRLRTNIRKNPVYLFECAVPEGKGQELFLQLCRRTNELAQRPEWYNTLTTTCTTSLVNAVNRVSPGRIPVMWRLFLPGHSPRAAYRLGLLSDPGGDGFEAVLSRSAISDRALAWEQESGFSRAIRTRQ